MTASDHAYVLRPIGRIRSQLRSLEDAPRQGEEGAADAWLELDARFVRALSGIRAGDEASSCCGSGRSRRSTAPPWWT